MEDRHAVYGGMTANERLVVSGSIQAFDAAIENGDRSAAIAVLAGVGLRSQAEHIVEVAITRQNRTV